MDATEPLVYSVIHFRVCRNKVESSVIIVVRRGAAMFHPTLLFSPYHII